MENINEKNNENIVIGVEGMVSSGKSSMCKELIKLIPNSIYIDAGYIYRGIILAIIKNKIDMDSAKGNILSLMKQLDVEFNVEDGITQIYIEGEKIKEEEVESMQNSMGVSKMASMSDNEPLFAFARSIIDNYKQHFNVICSGRDMVDIYPKMNCHLFITASLEARVKRRFNQYNGKYTEEEIRKCIEERDALHEKTGFNKFCNYTVKVDLTECNSAKESAEKVLSILKEKQILK